MNKNYRLSHPNRVLLKIDQYKPILQKKRSSMAETATNSSPAKTIFSKEKQRVPLDQNKLQSDRLQNCAHLKPVRQSKISLGKKPVYDRSSLVEKQPVFRKSASRSKTIYQPNKHTLEESNHPDQLTNQQQSIKIDVITDEFFEKLSNNFTLTVKSGQVTIKKQKFLELIKSKIKFLAGMIDPQGNDKGVYLVPTLSKIKILLTQMESLRKTRKLAMSQKYQQMFTPQSYKLQCDKKQNTLKCLIKGKQMILEEIQKLKDRKDYQSGICEQKQSQCLQWEKKIYDQKAKYDELCSKHEQLIRDHENLTKSKIKLEEDIQMLNEKGMEAFMFVENQKVRPFLNDVSKKYKYSQNLLLCYAYEMDKRVDMSSYDWEPQPFTAVFKNLKADQKRLLRRLDESDIPLDTKIQEMKDFVKCTISRFSAKEREMDKVFKRKTDAIKEYVEIVRVWSNQHQMKNQYLGTMRKEYGFDSEQVEKMVKLFEESELNEEQKSWVVTLRKYWDWVNLAFLYGNSFY